nr:hypothetical protein [Tanacetum cinerariifolium]
MSDWGCFGLEHPRGQRVFFRRSIGTRCWDTLPLRSAIRRRITRRGWTTEYIQVEDEVFPAEEQPLPAAASPITDSPGYIPESDPDEDPEDDDDEDPEEDPSDYPADHDDEEEEEEPSGDDADEDPKDQSEDIRYGIRDTWIDERDVAEEEALTTLEGVNTRVTELTAVQEQDTQDIYGVMEDAQ